MKTFTIHTVIRNLSRYPIERVWENAQDLEHVVRLHPTTNASFELLFAQKNPNSKNVYDTLIYRAGRRAGPFRMAAFGFRQIIAEFNIHQVEIFPTSGIVSALNSLLYRNPDREFPTLMVDEVVMEVPILLLPLRGWLTNRLHAHARVQCREDEPFRARRSELAEHGVNLPFRLFDLPKWDYLTKQFELSVETPVDFQAATRRSDEPVVCESHP